MCLLILITATHEKIGHGLVSIVTKFTVVTGRHEGIYGCSWPITTTVKADHFKVTVSGSLEFYNVSKDAFTADPLSVFAPGRWHEVWPDETADE